MISYLFHVEILYPTSKEADVKKLFQLIAAVRKGKRLQPYAPNNADQVSSDSEDDMGEDEESDGSPTESEFENDDDGSDNHHPDVTEPVPKKSRRDSAPMDDSKSELQSKAATTVPSKGRCSVGGSSGSGRSAERKEYDLLMAEIGELEAKMTLIRKLWLYRYTLFFWYPYRFVSVTLFAIVYCLYLHVPSYCSQSCPGKRQHSLQVLGSKLFQLFFFFCNRAQKRR